MTKATKILLTISLVSLAVGFTGPGSEILQGGLKPIGAIAFILFFISNLLAKEMALFDQEKAGASPIKKAEKESGPQQLKVPQHA